MADETVEVRERDLADRLGLATEAIREVAQRRTDAGAWAMWTDENGNTVYRIPVSELDDVPEAQPDHPPRSIRRTPDGAGSPAAPNDDGTQTAPISAEERDPESGDPAIADPRQAQPADHASTQPTASTADTPVKAAESPADLSDPGDETADLRDALRQVAEQRDTLQQEVDQLREDRDALQSERDTLRAELDAARQDADQFRDADANIRLKRDALQAEVDRLRGQPLRRLLARLLGRPRT